MRILCDTNILIRISQPDHPHHRQTVVAVSKLHAADNTLVTVPQACYEYYVVATRPVAQNGLGLPPDEAVSNVDDLLSLMRLLRDERSIFGFWKKLVRRHEVSGKPAHDARIVAAMQRHGVANLLTCNAKDFRRYDGITILEPADSESGIRCQ